MLGKKSLAIALMGLGLAGSCFAEAPTNSVKVDFKATVQANTCAFSVDADNTVGSGDTAAVVNFEKVSFTKEPSPCSDDFQVGL